MKRKQKLIAVSSAVVGLSLAALLGPSLYRSLCRLRFAENLILREKPRSESHWDLIDTARGRLIRMRNGKFRGWYLAADRLVNFAEGPPGTWPRRRISRISGISGSYARNLILRERVGDDCYWKLTGTRPGHRIQAMGGIYDGWYLGSQLEFVPDTGSDPRTAWNLVLTENLVPGTGWKLTRTAEGHLIQAKSGPFTDWYLDALLEARILERDLCRGEETRRDGPTPPLAK